MFCYQCEQTSMGKGCVKWGICGKSPDTAVLQDILIYSLKGLAMYAHRLIKMGIRSKKVDAITVDVLFTTITNVNFDPKRLMTLLNKVINLREEIKEVYFKECKEKGIEVEELIGPAKWTPELEFEKMIAQEKNVSILNRMRNLGSDITGLEELLVYGIKGLAAYIDHASILGKEDESIYNFIYESLDYITRKDVKLEKLVEKCLECGKVNLRAMEILDAAHTETYGHPEPTKVRIEPKQGKAILISGHDLKDLEEILKQSEGKGINIYTHGEMLPANAYPELKKYKHLAGNYGGAWQNQKEEFDKFPGAILMTTNCIQEPRDTYKSRIFTSGLVAWPGVKHISNGDFSLVIDAALKAEGFKEDGSDKTITIGFARNAILSVADKVIKFVKEEKIKHFFLVGGCDGAKAGRNYYTEFAKLVPQDSIILTLACGKYRFNKIDFGEIEGIPRLLDIGQCNDAYSAVKVALALSEAFGVGINELPLSFIISWYEQKAVAILLTLLYLGIKNIRLGPSLPAFITPSILKVLVENFNIMPIKTPQKDLEDILVQKEKVKT